MSTPLTRQGNAILNAIKESRVETVITLYDQGFFGSTNLNRREHVTDILVKTFSMPETEVSYWLDWFHV